MEEKTSSWNEVTEYAPSAEWGFSPLDEELALLPGSLTPRLQDDLTHLATWMPFEKARGMLKRMRGVEMSEATVRRRTESNGAAYVALQEAEVGRIEEELPDAPGGPDKQLLSVDGAMVPLVGGEWAEVKTLVLGVIGEPVIEGGEQKVHASEMSYFSRLLEAEIFTRLALVETHQRGVENAEQVIAVTDGAEWEQGFIDYHRADAVRILDFPHAAEYVGKIGAAVWGEETPETKKWLENQLKCLKHQGPAQVLSGLRTLVAAHPETPDLEGWLAYLEKREPHMQYPTCQEQGWPMGSGAVESGNKLVVEARLKGSGMHWAREHVNPMLGLRNAVCSDRWDEAWGQISDRQIQQAQKRRQIRREQHLAALSKALSDNNRLPIVDSPPQPNAVELTSVPASTPLSAKVEVTAQSRRPWRPPPDHPWRRRLACTPSRWSRSRSADAKK